MEQNKPSTVNIQTKIEERHRQVQEELYSLILIYF
jgi:hypothetical protein